MMTTKPNKKRRTKPQARVFTIPGLEGVRIVEQSGESKLELRNRLGMARENFGRLIDVSVRTIAEVESNHKKVKKLQRNYVQVNRLFDALSEVVKPESLRDWFLTPNKAFDGFKPIEIVERGEIDRLWNMVYQLRAGMPV